MTSESQEDLAESRDVTYHGRAHGPNGRDKVKHPLLGGLHTDSTGSPPTSPLALGDIIVAQGSPPTFQVLATGAAGTVFIGGSTFSVNLLITGYGRVGSATPLTGATTAGDWTAVRVFVGDAGFRAEIMSSNPRITVDADDYVEYTRSSNTLGVTLNSILQLTINASGRFTLPVTGSGAGIMVGGDALMYRVAANVWAMAHSLRLPGYLAVGFEASAPSNTTFGDITGLRGHFGTDGAFTSGKELEVVGDALVSATFEVGTTSHLIGKVNADAEVEIDGDLNHDGTNVGFYGHAPSPQATGGENVTNSVTDSGSTAGTIPDITDGVIYANDYTNLRRALFQLARMLKQDHDQLRAMGILT